MASSERMMAVAYLYLHLIVVRFVLLAEYLLGDDVLVAPVLERGAVTKDVYLPTGLWRDEVDPEHPLYTGPIWLQAYPAPLETLPYFTRVTPSND